MDNGNNSEAATLSTAYAHAAASFSRGFTVALEEEISFKLNGIGAWDMVASENEFTY